MSRKDSIHDYLAVAIRLVRVYHSPLLSRFRDDVIQECSLLAWEAESRGYITVGHGTKRKRFGNCRRMGMKTYTRAVQARLYVFKKNYYSY